MWKLHDTANAWHVHCLECFNSWINAEEMLITCQADHNKHALNKTGRLADCNLMTDYAMANYKSTKRDIALHSVKSTQPQYFYMNRYAWEWRSCPGDVLWVFKGIWSCSGNVPALLLWLGHFPIRLVFVSDLKVTSFQPCIRADWASAGCRRLFPWLGIKLSLGHQIINMNPEISIKYVILRLAKD